MKVEILRRQGYPGPVFLLAADVGTSAWNASGPFGKGLPKGKVPEDKQ